ncbi:PIN-like domain-containing protein [Streptomyces rimosus]|uniref:PIN-like domain-containing protein n=1 Tax=Streptomyces rimosus TaxID=1927 RepID=UPI00131CBAA8|nr:PIN-like domain-containing protein [Streptomyces rimosus]
MTDPALLQRFSAWLRPAPSPEDEERSAFFADGLIVLDTNALLSLYEYTSASREEVLVTLERVSERLWMPYQVGLEFVRGRHTVLKSRDRVLNDAKKSVNSKLEAALSAVLDAKKTVQSQLEKFARAPEEIAALDELINQQSVKELLAPYRCALTTPLADLKADHDLTSAGIAASDPILDKVAGLYGSRVGEEPGDRVVRKRLEEATEFRFPNEIPPGFADAGKETPLKGAGDFLLWEELVEEAGRLPEGSRRVLLVSNDAKRDWYDVRQNRPWPALFNELKRRAGADLRIETPPDFYDGIGKFLLHTALAAGTYEEIRRVSESFSPSAPEPLPTVTVTAAAEADPPSALLAEACRSVAFGSKPGRHASQGGSAGQRVFQWWLIGVTAQLGRRAPDEEEPTVDFPAAVRGAEAPGTDWAPGTELPAGYWVNRESSWIAQWFLSAFKEAAIADRHTMCVLAAQQAAESQ